MDPLLAILVQLIALPEQFVIVQLDFAHHVLLDIMDLNVQLNVPQIVMDVIKLQGLARIVLQDFMDHQLVLLVLQMELQERLVML